MCTAADEGVRRYLLDALRSFRGGGMAEPSPQQPGGGSGHNNNNNRDNNGSCAAGGGGGNKNKGKRGKSVGGWGGGGTKVVVNIVFARRCIAPGVLYDTDFEAQEFCELYRRLTSCICPPPPSTASAVVDRRFKRYRFQDLVYDLLPNGGHDAKVSRHSAAGSAKDCGGTAFEKQGGEGGGPRAVAAQTTCTRLPISAFPCRMDVDDVRYMRVTSVSLAHLIGHGAELRFEASHPHVSCWPIPSPPPGPRHRLSISLDIAKLACDARRIQQQKEQQQQQQDDDSTDVDAMVSSRLGRVVRLVMDHVSLTAPLLLLDDNGNTPNTWGQTPPSLKDEQTWH